MRGWLLLAALATACATAPSVSIEKRAGPVRPAVPAVTRFNLEDLLARGAFLEVQAYLESLPRQQRERDAVLTLAYGRTLLARGDHGAAVRELERISDLSATGRHRAEAEWALAQAHGNVNDFAEAAWHAEAAVTFGQPLAPGFVRFLEALADTPIDAGIAEGETLETPFRMEEYDLIRVPVRVNGTEVLAVLDTGASYSIVTRSFAGRVSLREIPDSDAWGRGLHQKEIPLTFGAVNRLELGGRTVTNVPVMIMPDEALTFDTSRGNLPIAMVLGLHLLKDFSVRIDYEARRLSFRRISLSAPRNDPEQNLFFARGKVLARVSVNQTGWFPFLLDTGSELTMVTSAGLSRMKLHSVGQFYPRRVQGIGKARVEWGKVRRVTIGLEGYLLRFQDVVIAELESPLENGVLGTSLLRHFRVTVDFEKMRLGLQT